MSASGSGWTPPDGWTPQPSLPPPPAPFANVPVEPAAPPPPITPLASPPVVRRARPVVVIVTLVIVMVSALVAFEARRPLPASSASSIPAAASSHVPSIPAETLPVPTTVSFPPGPDGRAAVKVCTPLGTTSFTMAGSPAIKGPKRPVGQGPEVVSLWLSVGLGPDSEEVAILTGVGGFGPDDATIGVKVSEYWGPDGRSNLSRSVPHRVGQHIEFDSTDTWSDVVGVTRVISRSGMVVMFTVDYNRIGGNAPYADQALADLQRLIASFQLPGLDGPPEGETCPRPTPIPI